MTDYSSSADLHTHTNFSDGAYSVNEVINKVAAAGITTLSITDHDTVEGLEEATAICKNYSINFVPGIEITTAIGNIQLHILGYFIDFSDGNFQRQLIRLREGRLKRAQRIITKLNKIRIPINLDTIVEKFGEKKPIGRPHIADMLVREGYANNYQEAFDRYLGIGRPAYERNHPFSPESAINMISAAGGLSILAHPSHYISEDVLLYLVKSGLNGIEVVHPSHSQFEENKWRRLASNNSLLISGGSDFHGGLRKDEDNLGKFFVEIDSVNLMKKKLNIAA
ncbi:MAG: PHP domain-containing protein [Candidatus Kryptoniota bacterium]